MKTQKRILCLVLCLCTVLSMLSSSASALSYVNKITVTVDAPAVGEKPGEATTSTTASSEVIDTEWSGTLDDGGCFQSGQKYTVTVTLWMKDTVDKPFKRTNDSLLTINGKQATVVSFTSAEVVLSYTFTSAAAAVTVDSLQATVAEPVAGIKPAGVTAPESDRLKVTKTEWIDSSGKTLSTTAAFQKGEAYTVRYTVAPKDASRTTMKLAADKVTMNGSAAEIVSGGTSSAVLQFTFAPVAEKLAVVPEDGKIKNAQFYMVKPVAGAKPAYSISVAQSDALYITNINWSGTFDENGCFIAKNKYSLSFDVNVRDGLDLTFPTGSYGRKIYLNDHLLSVGWVKNSGKTFSPSTNFTIEIPSTVVDVTKVFTQEQADAAENTRHAFDLIIDEALMKKHRLEKTGSYPIDRILYMDEYSQATRILIDFSEAGAHTPSGAAMFDHPNAKEIWLSPAMDVNTFLAAFKGHPDQQQHIYNTEGASTWDFTLYVSDQALPKGMQSLSFGSDTSMLRFRTLLYSGDVYEAFEKAGKGEQVGKEWCPGHVYTKEIMAADRLYQAKTCHNANWFYYSCKYCGKCEYNAKHLFAKNDANETVNNITGAGSHRWVQIIDPSHYLGKNADGDHVYALTCADCGFDTRHVESCDKRYYTEAIFRHQYGYNTEETYEQHLARMKDAWDKYGLKRALESTTEEAKVGFFVVDADKAVTEKTSSWAVNEINWAAQSDLLDKTLLGTDYTKTITRLQFCSVAIRMAEKLLGYELPASPANTFTDTNNIYVLKAHKAGIVNGRSATIFDPNGTLDREQMATFIYRTLMFVRDNSNVRFTTYESQLANYTDDKQISSWAKQSFEFMNALGLIKGNTATTLNPKGACTVEQALIAAYRSLSADQIGWYQCYKAEGMYPFYRNSDESLSQTSYAVGDRVWSTGTIDGSWLTVTDPYNGFTRLLAKGDFKPIKELKDGDAALYNQYVPN